MNIHNKQKETQLVIDKANCQLWILVHSWSWLKIESSARWRTRRMRRKEPASKGGNLTRGNEIALWWYSCSFFLFFVCWGSAERIGMRESWGNLEGILREYRKNPEGGRAEGLGVERSSSSPESTFSFSIPLVYWLSFFPRPGISMSTVDLRPFLSSFSFFLSFLNTCHFSSTSRPVIPHHSSFKYRSIKTQHNSWTILPALLSLDGIVDNRSKQHWWIQKIAIDGAG